MMTPRSIRDNNPFDIDKVSGQHWQGEVASTDPRFAEFQTPEDGIRAGIILLRNYQDLDHCATIRQIINRLAPRSENNTAAYVAGAAAACNVGPDVPVNVRDKVVLEPLVRFIIRQEAGAQPYTDEQIAAAMSAAGIQGA
jgi:hypothetical protein